MSGWGVVALGYSVAAVAWLVLALRARGTGR